MTLLNGEILWNLIWVLPLILLLFYWSRRKRHYLLQAFLGKRANDPDYVTASPVLRFWRAVLFCAVIILLFIAAARPSWGTSILPYSGQGRDLMVVFDVSKSMLSQDVRPSRLDHAKWLIRQIALKNPGDRFGLIAFAGHAFLECPLTIDKTSFLQSVDDLSVDTIPVGGTNIQQALTEAVRGFHAAESSYRAVILITDGDELTGNSEQALKTISDLKIPLFILGIGDPSQPSIIQIRDENGNVRTLKDDKGNVVSSPLNEKMLSALARRTGGIYVRSTTTYPGIREIDARIKKLDTAELDSGKQTRPIERPLYPLLAAFVLFCLWLLLPERRLTLFRRSSLKIILIGLSAISMSYASAQEKTTAPALTEKKTEEKTDLTPEQLYNQGLTAHTQEQDLKKALALYEQAVAAENASPEIRARASQNIGVLNHQIARAMLQQTYTALQSQQLDQALQHSQAALGQMKKTEGIYKDALRDSSNPEAAARNQQLLSVEYKKTEELKKKIEELKKKQQEARNNTKQAQQQNQQQQSQSQQQNQKQQQSQSQQQNQQQQSQSQQQNQQQQSQSQQQQQQQ